MNTFKGAALGSLLASTILVGFTAPAFAAAPAAEPVAVDPAAGEGLGEIIVTATKRETNLQKTPISISVVNAEALADRHVQSMINLMDGSVPSLRVATFEARQSALTVGIRGIVPYDANQTARDNGVGVYVDGVALGKTQGLNAALFDIERVEVLKGPQGTLFGRNTEGGAVSFVTKAPTGEFGGRLVGGVGNYGSRNGELHLDLPAYAGLALKFSGVYQHQDPTVKDPLAGSIGWNAYDRKGGRVQARYKGIDNLTVDLSYDYSQDDNTPFFSQLVSYNPNNYPVGTYVNPTTGVLGTQLFRNGVACGGTSANVCVAPLAPAVGVHNGRQDVADVGVPQQYSTDITHGVSGTIAYQLSPDMTIKSITAWRGVQTDQWDNSGGPERSTYAPNANFSRYSLSFLKQHQFSEELQLIGNIGDQIDYVVGGYYYTEKATEYAATPLSNAWNADGTQYTIRNPVVTGTVTSANSGYQPYAPSCVNTLAAAVPQFANSCQFITRASFAHDHNYSVFGQATYTPAGLDMIHITAGGRWTKDKRRGNLYVVNNAYQPFTFANSVSRFDPLVNLAFDASQDVHLYAKYATGFRAGGANDRSQQFNAFAPESVKSYEVGAKMDFFNHKARLNLAGYIMDRSNTQFDFDLFDTAAGSPTNGSHIEQTQNAGKSKIRGIEADLTVRPIDSLTLGASYAYTYWKAPSAVNPITGGLPQQLYIVYTPKNAASGSIDYALPVGNDGASVRFHMDGNYSDGYYSFELEPTKTDSSFIVNARLALANVKMPGSGAAVTFSLWSRNLFNRTYIYRRSAANSSPVQNYNGSTLVSTNYGGVLGDYANFNTPRTFGGEIAVRF